MAVPDSYKLFSLAYGADELTVRKRYRQLAKSHHPDVGGHEEEFRLLNEAFKEIIWSIRNECLFQKNQMIATTEEEQEQAHKMQFRGRDARSAPPAHERTATRQACGNGSSTVARTRKVEVERGRTKELEPIKKWRHAVYERHPFVTLFGLSIGLLLVGWLFRLISSSWDTSNVDSFARMVARAAVMQSFSLEPIASSNPLPFSPSSPADAPALVLKAAPNPPSFSTLPPFSNPALYDAPPAGPPLAISDPPRHRFPNSPIPLPSPRPFSKIVLKLGESAVIRKSIEYELIIPLMRSTTLAIVAGGKVQFAIGGKYRKCASTIVFKDPEGLQPSVSAKSCGRDATLILRRIATTGASQSPISSARAPISKKYPKAKR